MKNINSLFVPDLSPSSKHERAYYLIDHYPILTVISEMRIIQKALNERWQYVYRVEIKHVGKQYGLFWYFFRVYSFINKWKFYFSDREKFYFPDALHKAFGFSIDVYHVDVTLSYKEKNTYLRYENSPHVCNTQHNLFNWKDLIFMIMDHEFLKKYINVCKKIRKILQLRIIVSFNTFIVWIISHESIRAK